jgi:predicted DNA-binding protein (UPF0251 family)
MNQLPAASPDVSYALIPGHPLYAAGSDGSIWSCQSGRWRRLKTRTATNGYLLVTLYQNKVTRYARVHALILEAFVGPRQVGFVCRHLNGNQTDNRLSNLSWGTATENAQDRIRHGRGVTSVRQQQIAIKHPAELVTLALSLRSSGVPINRIVAETGISRGHLYRFFRGHTTRPDIPRPERTDLRLKLTESQVAEVRRLSSQGVRQSDIARQLGVSRATICLIVSGRRRRTTN